MLRFQVRKGGRSWPDQQPFRGSGSHEPLRLRAAKHRDWFNSEPFDVSAETAIDQAFPELLVS
jgi:hypothetical protein